MRDDSQLPHRGRLKAGHSVTVPGKPREGCSRCIRARLAFTAPQTRVPRPPRVAAMLTLATSAVPRCPSARGEDGPGATFHFRFYCPPLRPALRLFS